MAGSMHVIPELDRKGYRDFALTTGGIVGVLFGLFFPWVFDNAFPAEYPLWPWILCGILVVWGFVAPMSLKPVYTNWMKFGNFMGGRIMTPLIMFIVFALMFVPIGLVMRLFGKDLLSMKLDGSTETYRVVSNKPPTKNLEKPF